MARKIRPISWMKPARKEFEKFPKMLQDDILDVLSTAAEGRKAYTAKPMKGLGSGVLEIALIYRKGAYRIIYVLQLDDDIWVVHAF